MVAVQLSLLSHCFTAPLQVIYGKILWEDTILQGEGGKQGDAMMPLLFSLGQHSALAAVQAQMGDGEVLLAFHDDIYTVTMPERDQRDTGASGENTTVEQSR